MSADAAPRTADAAEEFLASLDAAQTASARSSFDDDQVRHDWHYVPRSRPGLCFADMAARQQKLALDLLGTALSDDAFALACLVMALEDPLDRSEGGRGPRRGRNRSWGRHRAEYHAVVFGAPGGERWGWRIEGHHLSVTATVVDGVMVSTPTFLGANPAEVAAVRLMPREQDLAFALLGGLDEARRGRALLSGSAPDDILTRNAAEIGDLIPRDEGVLLGDLDGEICTVADALVDCYVSRFPPESAMHHVSRGALRFVFAGEPVHRRPHYYRLFGPDLLVEYDNTQNEANHIHTVVRHPSGDFGADLLRRHYRTRHP